MFLKLFSLAGAFLCFIVTTYLPTEPGLAANKKAHKRERSEIKKTRSVETTKNWEYQVLKDTMTVRIIEYYKAHSYCGTKPVTAMAICIDNKGDSLRIIELCPGPKDFKTGDLLDFYPYSHITQNKKSYEKYKMSDEYLDQYRFNTVNKTTFAKLSKHMY